MTKKNEIPQKLLIDLIDSWNAEHPEKEEQINPELINIILTYLNYSYTTGTEDTFRAINKLYDSLYPGGDSSSGKFWMSKALIKDLFDPKTYDL